RSRISQWWLVRVLVAATRRSELIVRPADDAGRLLVSQARWRTRSALVITPVHSPATVSSGAGRRRRAGVRGAIARSSSKSLPGTGSRRCAAATRESAIHSHWQG